MSGTAGRLPCGEDLDRLLEQVADQLPAVRPEHQAVCPHCRAALAELTVTFAPLRELAAEPVRAPGWLGEAVMARVRALARDPWHGTLPGSGGVTRIAAWVVAAIARRAAQHVPGVEAVFGRTRVATVATPAPGLPGDRPGGPGASRRSRADGVGVAGRSVVVDLDVVATYGQPLDELASRVRRSVVRIVQALTGLDVVEVNVTVVDVRAPDPT